MANKVVGHVTTSESERGVLAALALTGLIVTVSQKYEGN